MNTMFDINTVIQTTYSQPELGYVNASLETQADPSTTPFPITTAPPATDTIISEENFDEMIYPTPMLGFTAACAFILAILGFCGNLLTIMALSMCKKLKSKTATAFVINLAIVEMLFCILILPVSGAQYLSLQYTTEPLLPEYACSLFTFMRFSLTQVELQTILGVALTRALAVSCTSIFRHIDNPSFMTVYIILIWIYSSGMKLPTALGYWGSYTFNKKTMECDLGTDEDSNRARKIHTLIDAVIPVVVIILLYIFIFGMVKKSSRRVSRVTLKAEKKELAQKLSSSGETSTRKTSSSSLKELKKIVRDGSIKSQISRKESGPQTRSATCRRDMRVARTIFIVFMMIIICSVPVAVIHGINKPSKMPKTFLAIHILYWLQYCLNVVVYVLMNRQYRDAYIDLLVKIFPSLEKNKGFRFSWERQSHFSKNIPQRNNSSIRGVRSNGHVEEELNNHECHSPLTAIPEGSSSKMEDDVFIPDNRKIEENKENAEVLNPLMNGKESQKEIWVHKNGVAENSSRNGHIV